MAFLHSIELPGDEHTGPRPSCGGAAVPLLKLFAGEDEASPHVQANLTLIIHGFNVI